MDKPLDCLERGAECRKCVEVGVAAAAIVLKHRGIEEPRMGLLLEAELPKIRARIQDDPGVVDIPCPARQARATRIGISQAEQISQ